MPKNKIIVEAENIIRTVQKHVEVANRFSQSANQALHEHHDLTRQPETLIQLTAQVEKMLTTMTALSNFVETNQGKLINTEQFKKLNGSQKGLLACIINMQDLIARRYQCDAENIRKENKLLFAQLRQERRINSLKSSFQYISAAQQLASMSDTVPQIIKDEVEKRYYCIQDQYESLISDSTDPLSIKLKAARECLDAAQSYEKYQQVIEQAKKDQKLEVEYKACYEQGAHYSALLKDPNNDRLAIFERTRAAYTAAVKVSHRIQGVNTLSRLALVNEDLCKDFLDITKALLHLMNEFSVKQVKERSEYLQAACHSFSQGYAFARSINTGINSYAAFERSLNTVIDDHKKLDPDAKIILEQKKSKSKTKKSKASSAIIQTGLLIASEKHLAPVEKVEPELTAKDRQQRQQFAAYQEKEDVLVQQARRRANRYFADGRLFPPIKRALSQGAFELYNPVEVAVTAVKKKLGNMS